MGLREPSPHPGHVGHLKGKLSVSPWEKWRGYRVAEAGKGLILQGDRNIWSLFKEPW